MRALAKFGNFIATILCSTTRDKKASECDKFYLFKSAIESNESNHLFSQPLESQHVL